MKGFKYLIFIFLLFLYCGKVSAATGCLIGSTLYTGSSSSINILGNYTFTGSVTSVLVNCPVNDNTSQHAVDLKSFNTWLSIPSECRITSSGTFNGITQTYNLVLCPIDEDMPYMLLGISSLGFLFICRRNFSI